MSLTLDTPIENLYMVGEAYAEKLEKYLNIHTVRDLLYHFPFRYDDLSAQKDIAQITPGEMVTLTGQILSISNTYTRNHKQIQKAVFTDGISTLEISWFNQPYLVKTLTPGTRVNLAGKVSLFGRKPTLVSPKYEVLKNIYQESSTKPETTHTGRLVPVYPETFGVSSKWLRSRINAIIKQLDSLIEDWLPPEITTKEHLLPLSQALYLIHFPKSYQDIEKAKRRLAFDELLLMHLQVRERKSQWQTNSLRYHLSCQKTDLQPFIQTLPFKLTRDQEQAIAEIVDDLNKPIPMNRLLEGDVGSGKTVVAAAAIFLVHKAGYKTAIMAPTEVLAHQHYKTLQALLQPQGIKIGFYTGAKKSDGNLKDYDVYLGTHALLFRELSQEPVGLVIIDEQHRFGVEQRAKLIGRGTLPHVLTMTATPIPRTVALTLYGDLSLSMITTQPLGRKPVKTWIVPESKRKDGYNWISEQILKEQIQAYFIYPLIDESEKMAMSELKAVTKEIDGLKLQFPNLRIGLLHGRLKSAEKQAVMQNFANHELDILASTTVIEVGIDIPNANIIVIENAQRFGLSQLHQLRGRVGRSDRQSYCLLFTNAEETSNKRLKAMENTYSGIALAELDLKLRGPGQLYGTQQSGFAQLKIASLDDETLIALTSRYAGLFHNEMEKYPLLRKILDTFIIGNVQPN